MGLFGTSSGKKLLTDLSGAWGQFDPSNPDYLPGPYAPSSQPAPQPAPQQAPPAQERWLNGGKFRGRDAIGLALGAIGDAFSQHNGGQAAALPMVLNGLQSARDAKQAARAAMTKHEQDRQDYLWEQQHKTPAPNDTERDYQFWKDHMTPDQFGSYVQNKAEPPQYRQGPDGQFYRVSPQAAPTAPVGRLTPLPGGGAGNGAGGFHIPSGNPLDPYRR